MSNKDDNICNKIKINQEVNQTSHFVLSEKMEVVLMLFMFVFVVGILAGTVAMVIGLWKVFEKVGIEGWKSLIPFYNWYLMVTQIAKKEVKYFWGTIIGCAAPIIMGIVSMLFLFINDTLGMIGGILYVLVALAAAGLICAIILFVSFDIAQNFGKTKGFGVGLALAPYIFYTILGFGKAKFLPVTLNGENFEGGFEDYSSEDYGLKEKLAEKNYNTPKERTSSSMSNGIIPEVRSNVSSFMGEDNRTAESDQDYLDKLNDVPKKKIVTSGGLLSFTKNDFKNIEKFKKALLETDRDGLEHRLKEVYQRQKLEKVPHIIARILDILVGLLVMLNGGFYILAGIAIIGYGIYRLVKPQNYDKDVYKDIEETMNYFENYQKFKKGELNFNIDEKKVIELETKVMKPILKELLFNQGFTKIVAFIPIINGGYDEVHPVYVETLKQKSRVQMLMYGTPIYPGLNEFTTVESNKETN